MENSEKAQSEDTADAEVAKVDQKLKKLSEEYVPIDFAAYSIDD